MAGAMPTLPLLYQSHEIIFPKCYVDFAVFDMRDEWLPGLFKILSVDPLRVDLISRCRNRIRSPIHSRLESHPNISEELVVLK